MCDFLSLESGLLFFTVNFLQPAQNVASGENRWVRAGRVHTVLIPHLKRLKKKEKNDL